MPSDCTSAETFHLNDQQQTESDWDKFMLLMWKNYVLQWRHKIRTLFEFVIPIFLIVLLVQVRGLELFKQITYSNMTYKPYEIGSFDIIRYYTL